MANPQNRAGARNQVAGLEDRAPRPRTLIEYDVPDAEGLLSETTESFGSIRTIVIRLLTPLEEKDAAGAAKDDGMQMAYELARRSIAAVVNDREERIEVHNHDGSSNMLWAQMHPKLRQLAMQGYADNAAPDTSTRASFLKSRRIKA